MSTPFLLSSACETEEVPRVHRRAMEDDGQSQQAERNASASASTVGFGGGDKKQMVGQYELGRVLGAGAFCKVLLGRKSGGDDLFAVKIVNKDSIRDIRDLERVMREMHVLKHISHPNIISMHESIEKGSRLYLVLDFANAGELYGYCKEQGPLPDKVARVFMTQILSGVDFMHRQGVSHRDLKPENILLVETSDVKSDGIVCKIADFGLSNDMKPGDMLKTICGTPTYAAPEITLGHKYDGVAVDLWSLGCILLFMLSGELAFKADSQPELFSKIQKGSFSVPMYCSPEASDLVHSLIQVKPAKRLAIGQCWQHAWLATKRFEFSFDDEDLEQELLALSVESDREEQKADGGGDEGARTWLEGGRGNMGPSSIGGMTGEGGDVSEVLELLPSCIAASAFKHAASVRGEGGSEGFTNEVEVTVCGEDSSPSAPAAMTSPSSPHATASNGGLSGIGARGRSTSIRCKSTRYKLLWVSKTSTDAQAVRTTSSPPTSTVLGVLRSRRTHSVSGLGTGEVGSPPSPVSPDSIRRRSTPAMPSSLASSSSFRGLGGKTTSLPSASSPPTAGSLMEGPPSNSRLSGANMAVVITKEPKQVLKDLQRLFADYKVSLRSQIGWSLKGEKNRVRFDMTLARIVQVAGSSDKVPDNLLLLAASRVTGDVVSFRDIARRLLLKL